MASTLENVRELAPTIAKRADEIEQLRELPADLVDALRAAGVFRMYVPRSHGGDELDSVDAAQVIEEVARADGSVGWLAAIGADSPAFFALLPTAAYDAVYADGPDVVHAGSLLPRGQAVQVDGGYRFTGQWPFASGCRHADYIAFNAFVVPDGDAGSAPQPGIRFAVVRPDVVEILDTWHVSGMKGTGSHDVTVSDLFVPAEWTASLLAGPSAVRHPLDSLPILGRLGLELVAVAIGLGQGALDDVAGIAVSKRPLGGLRGRMAEDPILQHTLGRLDVELRIGRTALHDVARHDCERAKRGEPLEPAALATRRATLARIVELAASVVDGCYHASGTTGLYDTCPLQRRLRDVKALTQHAIFTANPYSPVGASLVGEPMGSMLM